MGGHHIPCINIVAYHPIAIPPTPLGVVGVVPVVFLCIVLHLFPPPPRLPHTPHPTGCLGVPFLEFCPLVFPFCVPFCRTFIWWVVLWSGVFYSAHYHSIVDTPFHTCVLTGVQRWDSWLPPSIWNRRNGAHAFYTFIPWIVWFH